MADRVVSVAVPVLDGGPRLAAVLSAVRSQRVDRPLELIVADSGSTDGSVEVARAHGAEVVEVAPGEFSHGGTRNVLMERSAGDHVAFLTQDAVPAGELWLSRLLAGFEVADDVALVCGPYRAEPGAPHTAARELEQWFASFVPDGGLRIDRLPVAERDLPLGPTPRTFFSDANGCVARWAWRRIPYRRIPYAEDQMLAVDMLRAGFAKVHDPRAAVEHSHAYGPWDQLRRCFDEWRGLREVYGHVEVAAPRPVAARIRRETRADRAWLRARGADPGEVASGTLHSLRFHGVRAVGAALGSRADRLPAEARRRLSLEGRATFEPSWPTGARRRALPPDPMLP
jgi:glycosyltransferase involved in cell wall biosynthesis